MLTKQWDRVKVLQVNDKVTVEDICRHLGPSEKSQKTFTGEFEVHCWYPFTYQSDHYRRTVVMLVVYTDEDGRIANYVKKKPEFDHDSLVTERIVSAGALDGDKWVEAPDCPKEDRPRPPQGR